MASSRCHFTLIYKPVGVYVSVCVSVWLQPAKHWKSSRTHLFILRFINVFTGIYAALLWSLWGYYNVILPGFIKNKFISRAESRGSAICSAITHLYKNICLRNLSGIELTLKLIDTRVIQIWTEIILLIHWLRIQLQQQNTFSPPNWQLLNPIIMKRRAIQKPIAHALLNFAIESLPF